MRPFKVPLGTFGVWAFSFLGIFGCLLAIACGFIPTDEIEKSHLLFFELFLCGGIVLFCLVPIIIHSVRKPSWHLFKRE